MASKRYTLNPVPPPAAGGPCRHAGPAGDRPADHLRGQGHQADQHLRVSREGVHGCAARARTACSKPAPACFPFSVHMSKTCLIRPESHASRTARWLACMNVRVSDDAFSRQGRKRVCSCWPVQQNDWATASQGTQPLRRKDAVPRQATLVVTPVCLLGRDVAAGPSDGDVRR